MELYPSYYVGMDIDKGCLFYCVGMDIDIEY
jgi:hypothetical protein